MSVEDTLSIVKPDAVRRDLTGKIIAMFEEKKIGHFLMNFVSLCLQAL